MKASEKSNVKGRCQCITMYTLFALSDHKICKIQTHNCASHTHTKKREYAVVFGNEHCCCFTSQSVWRRCTLAAPTAAIIPVSSWNQNWCQNEYTVGRSVGRSMCLPLCGVFYLMCRFVNCTRRVKWLCALFATLPTTQCANWFQFFSSSSSSSLPI